MRTPLLAVLLLQACSTTPTGHTAVTHDGAYTVHWTTTVNPIELDDYFVITATVHPVPEALVIDAVMPTHRHGMLNDTTMRRIDVDTWTATDMLFHMPGLWRVRFDLTDADGTVHRAETDVELE